ncbi:uncharacterized protein LOC108738550 [Agrilus planipennis]|uniref:Uncharacterized protein LOC108738550 n=1 Tax=Agrilus planipennis TaxID=224129 RepID=A0A1W4WUE1_AGRPL|nr:uncharacterized protein LOC108738550 [Agrilus planipennis]
MTTLSTLVFLFLLCLNGRNVQFCDSKAVGYNFSHVHSDLIVTTGVKAPDVPETKRAVPVQPEEDKEPGWMRRQLMKFGEVSTKIGNSLGGTASKLTGALDKICQVIKTVIPVIAAVCHVGKFQFCSAATEGPQELANAIAPNNFDLELDR